MDNAASCDVLANELAILIPEFRGNASRTRCFAHITPLSGTDFIFPSSTKAQEGWQSLRPCHATQQIASVRTAASG
ncbi:hypothetical protein EV401DRAFT_1974295 [Pisolithus croceorrhizus]|nr:hypothetical protein EV401DRAFT_1974295 [Pisolithus croceorrhizus]